eukprot:jgi/Chlat1/7370/Chrsp6S07409
MATSVASSAAVSLSSASALRGGTPVKQQKRVAVRPAAAAAAVRASLGAPESGVEVSRREALVSFVTTSAALLVAAPAFAEDVQEKYARETKDVIGMVRTALSYPKGAPEIETAVDQLRKTTNDWVARYRREDRVAGRTSYSNVYTALNALAGHYNSFGPTYPLPAKRKERVLKEMDIAETALGKGR